MTFYTQNKKGEEMNEKVLKSIGFPLKMLNIIDKYAAQERISRSDAVRRGMEEFIVKHKLEKLK